MSCTSTPPRALEYTLLGLVGQQPMHGYEIYQRLKTHEILGTSAHPGVPLLPSGAPVP